MRRFVGIDLGGTNIRAAVVTEEGAVLSRSRTPTLKEQGPMAVVGRMADLVASAAREAGVRPEGISACGIGSPGPLDAAEGVVIFTPNLPGWERFPVAARLSEKTGVPCFLEGDANSAAFGEFWLGAGRGSSEMLIYTLGTGVGGGAILCGKLHRGRDQMAGHFGHAVVVADGRQCGCGSKGCLEQYCSATAVAREAREATAGGQATGLEPLVPDAISAHAVYEAAVAGSDYCRELLERTGRYLGYGIGTMVNALDPQVVVVYGGMAAAGDYIMDECRRAVTVSALMPAKERVKVVLAELGEDAGMTGAAGLAMRRLDGETAV